MAWKTCLVCGDVSSFGELSDKRIHKTICTPFCMSVILDWVLLPDPKPSMIQHYLNCKYPNNPPKADMEDADGQA